MLAVQIDTLPEELRAKAVKKATKMLHQTLSVTKFGKAPVIPVAAKPGMRDHTVGVHSALVCRRIARFCSCNRPASCQQGMPHSR